jgi:hypothetical protein
MVTKIFSEMLPGSGLPVSSIKGFGLPGWLHARSTPKRADKQAKRIDAAATSGSTAFSASDRLVLLNLLSLVIRTRHPTLESRPETLAVLDGK